MQERVPGPAVRECMRAVVGERERRRRIARRIDVERDVAKVNGGGNGDGNDDGSGKRKKDMAGFGDLQRVLATREEVCSDEQRFPRYSIAAVLEGGDEDGQ